MNSKVTTAHPVSVCTLVSVSVPYSLEDIVKVTPKTDDQGTGTHQNLQYQRTAETEESLTKWQWIHVSTFT